MPTISPKSQGEPHRQRRMAESFGSDAERYDRVRPRYPEAMVAAIVAASPGPDVLDVGCGTGISARAFQAAGCRVLGVDVDARMAAFARDRGLEVEVAAFEDWDPAGRTFDSVIAGQTWHWVDPLAGAAKAAAVLRPTGRLAAFWNVFDPAPEVMEAFSAVYERVAPELPSARSWTTDAGADAVLSSRTAEGIRQAGAFGELEEWRFTWQWPYTRGEWLEHVQTTGDAGELPPARMDELLAGIGAAVDALGGSFTMGYSALVLTAARTS